MGKFIFNKGFIYYKFEVIKVILCKKIIKIVNWGVIYYRNGWNYVIYFGGIYFFFVFSINLGKIGM